MSFNRLFIVRKFRFYGLLNGLLLAYVVAVNFPLMGQSHDLVIYGATSAGVTASIQGAKLGHKVLLIEPSNHLGGMLVEGLGGSDIDNHGNFQNSPAVSGLALEFYRRIAKAYDRLEKFEQVVAERIKDPSVWRFESSVAEQVIMEWLAEYPQIKTLSGQRLLEGKGAVIMDQGKIISLSLESGMEIGGKVFVDATIEGDLLAAAGISYAIGRESNATYGETLNGIRGENTYRQFEVNMDPYRIPGDPKSGLIPTVQDENFGLPGEGDDRLQAFCFRVCLTQDTDNQLPFQAPPNYLRDEYEIYLRYLRAGGKLYTPRATLPNGKTDLGAWHDLSHNLYGMNRGYPDASYQRREEILDYHREFTQGLFYFLALDPEVGKLDSALQKIWATWGLAKDEFVDNDGWPRNFYVRDGRRLVSDYVITEHHVRNVNPKPVTDAVALAFWPPDVHHVRRIVKDGYAYNEGFVFGGDAWRPLPISYQALLPKASECTNLITPTCISSSHIAYGAIRIEWTFMVLGQSAAFMADQAISRQILIQSLDYGDLKGKITKAGIVLNVNSF